MPEQSSKKKKKLNSKSKIIDDKFSLQQTLAVTNQNSEKLFRKIEQLGNF